MGVLVDEFETAHSEEGVFTLRTDNLKSFELNDAAVPPWDGSAYSAPPEEGERPQESPARRARPDHGPLPSPQKEGGQPQDAGNANGPGLDGAGAPTDAPAWNGSAHPKPSERSGEPQERPPHRARPDHGPLCAEFMARAEVIRDLEIIQGLQARLIEGGYLNPSDLKKIPPGCYSADFLWDKPTQEAFANHARVRLTAQGHTVGSDKAGVLKALKEVMGAPSAAGGSAAKNANVTTALSGASGPWVDGHLGYRAAAAMMDKLDAMEAAAQAQVTQQGAAPGAQ